MKKFVVFLVIFMMLSAFAMAAGSGQSSGSQAAPGAKTEIRASYWGEALRVQLYSNIIAEFEKANPDVTVVREIAPFNEYFDKLVVQVAGGNAADFLAMHPRFAADYFPRGVFEVLDPYIANKTISTAGWAQGAIDMGKFGGKSYALAMGVTYQGSMIDLALFKNLGVAPPAFEWTWDDVRSKGLEVKAAWAKQGKTSGYWFIGDESWDTNFNNFRYYVRNLGREAYKEDGTLGFTAKDLEDYFNMWKDFRDIGIAPDAAASTEYQTASFEASMFGKGRLLLTNGAVNQIFRNQSTFPDKELAIIRIPKMAKAVMAGEFPEGGMYGVYAKSTAAKKTAAARLLNFWLNDERSLKLYLLDQGVPGNTPLVEKVVIPLLPPMLVKAANHVNIVSKIATASPNPPIGTSQIAQEYFGIAQQVAFGTKTPAVAVKEFMDLANGILAKNKR